MSIPPITYAFIAAVVFSGLNASVGYLTTVLDVPVAQVILIRNSFVFILATGYITITRVAHAPLGPGSVRKYMIVSGLGVAVSVMTGYYSMLYLSLSEFTTLRCMDPFATALLCRIVLGERVTKTQICCCLLSIIGVILVTDPFAYFDVDETSPTTGHLSNTLVSKLLGVMLCIPSMFGQAAELVSMRKVGDQATAAQMLVYLGLCPAVAAAGYLTATRTALVGVDTGYGWIVLFGVIPLGFAGQYTITYAGQRISGTQVSIAMYFGVVSSTLLQWMIYGDHPSVIAFVGMLIIVVCGIYAAMYGSAEEDRGQADEVEDVVEEINLPLLSTER